MSELKRNAAQAAMAYIEEDMVIGVGTGSTVNYFIQELAAIKHKINACVASSKATEALLRAAGIPVVELNSVIELPIKTIRFCSRGIESNNLLDSAYFLKFAQSGVE